MSSSSSSSWCSGNHLPPCVLRCRQTVLPASNPAQVQIEIGMPSLPTPHILDRTTLEVFKNMHIRSLPP